MKDEGIFQTEDARGGWLDSGRNDILLQNKFSAKPRSHSFLFRCQKTARFENGGQTAVTLEKS